MKSLKKIINTVRQSMAKKKVISSLERDPATFLNVENELLAMRGLAKNIYGLFGKNLARSAPDAYFHALERGCRRWMKTTEKTYVRKTLHEGVWINVDISNVAEWIVYIKGGHDVGVMYWIRTLGRKGSTLIDVGANVGLMTIPMANATGDGGRVIAYEPYAESYARLVENCREACIKNTELRNVALGEVTGEMQLHIPKNKGAATLIARGDAESVRVSVERPTDLGENISVIKVDVEGFESNVLLALEKVIKQSRPALIIETTFDSRALEYLVDIGYELREVINHPPFSRPVRERDGKQIEILALPKESDMVGSTKTTLAESSRTTKA